MFNVARPEHKEMTADRYYRFAQVPDREQAQAFRAPGLGIIGTMASAAKLVQTPISGGMVDYTLVFPKEG